MNQTLSIAFIIVTYNEVFYDTISFKTLIHSIQVSNLNNYRIYIYDNTDKASWHIQYDTIAEKEKINYFHDKSNPGISVAYNKMAKEADEWGANWIALFDQDTTLPENIVSEYIKAIRNNPEVVLKVPVLYVNERIFSPMRLVFMRSFQIKKSIKQFYSLSKFAFVNSGLLVDLNFFKKTGGYNEKIKLDFADFQFINNAKKYVVEFEVLSVICMQNFSNNEKNIIKALKRYDIYIKDLRNCKMNGFLPKLCLNIVGLLHLSKLSYSFRTFRFIKHYIYN